MYIMDTSVPSTMMAYPELFRQSFPAPHVVYARGDVWALAMLGATRKCMTHIARTCVFVGRHLASGERLAEMRCPSMIQWQRIELHRQKRGSTLPNGWR